MKNITIAYALSNNFFYKNEEYKFFSSNNKFITCVKIHDSKKRIKLPSNTVVQIYEGDAQKTVIFLKEIIEKTVEDLNEFKKVLESLEVQHDFEKEICEISG